MFKPLKDKHKINVAMEKYYHWDDDVRSALEGFLNDLARKKKKEEAGSLPDLSDLTAANKVAKEHRETLDNLAQEWFYDLFYDADGEVVEI